MKFVKDQKRTNYCGELSSQNVGQSVTIMGWVDSRRDHGNLVFIDLRDREGIVQVVLDPNKTDTTTAKDFRGEYVVAIYGVVKARPDGMKNAKIKTGEIEVEALRCEILNTALTLPFRPEDDNVNEVLR
ncbi:MAG: aspartate--tRNA ligase, partial [Moraxellaceae bacterium]|nr:aspartate--tRNA ligase [Pseudobdellovibrionaceae bacterium]